MVKSIVLETDHKSLVPHVSSHTGSSSVMEPAIQNATNEIPPQGD